MRGYRKIQPWVVWGLGAMLFFSEYFARVDPSIIVSELMSYFHVGALALANISAFFYYPYIAMQIPVGSLVDRYGPHRLLTGAAFLCGISCWLFSYAYDVRMAEFARAMMGFSAAFAFVGALKLATIWFEPKKLGLLAGLTQGMGMLGAAVGEGAFATIVDRIGWRSTVMLIGTIILIIGILIALLVRDKRPGLLAYGAKHETTQINAWQGLMIVFRNRNSWLNALYAGLIYAPTAAIAELWGPNYLIHVRGLGHETAALAISMIFIGWAVGGPLIGWLSDRVLRRKPMMIISSVLSLIFLVTVLYVPNLPTVALFILLFCYGLSNTGVAIAYAVAGELNPIAVSGLSMAFTNMASIMVGALFQPVIGWLLEKMWDGTIVNGIPFYSIANYQHAVMILPVCFVVAFFLVYFIKETHCSRD